MYFTFFFLKREGYIMPFNRICEITSGYTDFEIQYSELNVRHFTLKEGIGYGSM